MFVVIDVWTVSFFMPPKKKENKASGEAVEGEDPIQFLQNYQKFCK